MRTFAPKPNQHQRLSDADRSGAATPRSHQGKGSVSLTRGGSPHDFSQITLYPRFPLIQRQQPPFDWNARVAQARSLPKDKVAEGIYKDLIVRAATNVAAKAPLVDRKPSVADIRWFWEPDSRSPNSVAVTDPQRIDESPGDYWQWISFHAVAGSFSQVEVEGTLLHELDHASHAKTIYDNWIAAGSPGSSWDKYWSAHDARWKEPSFDVVSPQFGLPAAISPSAIEFRAYAADLIQNFHRADRIRQAYLGRAVVLFYPLSKQAVPDEPAGVSDPLLDVAKTRRQLLLYYTIGLAKLDPTQSPYVKVLLAREMQKALVNRPAADHERIKADFPLIFAEEPSEEERLEAEKNYKPAP